MMGDIMEYFMEILFLFLSIALSLLVYMVGNKLIRVYLIKKMKNNAPFFVSFVDDSVKTISLLLSIFLFLMISSFALKISYTNIFESVLDNIVIFLPRIFVVSLIFIISFIFMKTISNLSKKFDYKYASAFGIFLQSILLIAAILTILEYMGVQATPFLDLFRVVIYTVGLTIALSLGIAIGFSIQHKMGDIIYNKKHKR